MVLVDKGDDLFEFALLIATFNDWLMICHVTVPAVCSCQILRLLSWANWSLYRHIWLKHACRHYQVGDDK